MSRPIDDPTREYPNYATGRAEPDPTSPAPQVEPSSEPPPAPRARIGVLRGLFLAGGVATLLVALLIAALTIKALPGFDNPFADKTTDRSQPVLLQSMRDLSRFVGADGTFQVVIDMQENKDNIPDFLLNRRTLFVASGTIEAYVDFSGLTEGAIKPNADNTAVEITLPAPQLGKAALDVDKSHVFAEEKGALNVIGDLFNDDPNRQQKLYQLGEQRISAAAQESGLAQRAQENTRKMLEGLLAQLGYTKVTVTFASP
jgi:hypothetical protein